MKTFDQSHGIVDRSDPQMGGDRHKRFLIIRRIQNKERMPFHDPVQNGCQSVSQDAEVRDGQNRNVFLFQVILFKVLCPSFNKRNPHLREDCVHLLPSVASCTVCIPDQDRPCALRCDRPRQLPLLEDTHGALTGPVQDISAHGENNRKHQYIYNKNLQQLYKPRFSFSLHSELVLPFLHILQFHGCVPANMYK